MSTGRSPSSQRPPSRGPRVNEAIRAREVRLIATDGSNRGVVDLATALAEATAAGLDLVEVAPDVTPPVCKVADAGKLRYEASQRERAARRTRHDDIKEIKLRPTIGEHDYQVKLRKLLELAGKGHRVKVTVTLRGRMQSRPEAADETLDRLAADVADVAECESRRRVGRNAFMMVVPRKGHR